MSNYYTLAIALSLLIVVGVALAYVSTKPVTLDSAIRIADATLKDRTIVDFGISTDGTVTYSYLADAVPERLAENEIPELRNENSYTKFIEIVEDGDEPIVKLEAHFYAQPAYAQDAGGSWRYLEYATTTEQAFRDRDMTLRKALTELVVRTAYADSVSPFVGSGDGYTAGGSTVIFQPDEATCKAAAWSNARSAGASVNGTTPIIPETYLTSFFGGVDWDCSSAVSRVFLPYDTGAVLCSDASISSASLNIYISGKVNSSNDGLDYLTIVRTSQATHTTLEDLDHTDMGGTEGIDSGDRKDITSISTGAYLSFALNATGRGWIALNGQASNCSSSSGISCFGIRDGNDLANSPPVANVGENSVTATMSENSGTSQDPYLSVTFTGTQSCLITPAVRSGMKIGAYGSLKVTSGGIKIK